jgi:hypothetical protein
MVKIFTMVKDEADIVNDWIIYHASMFGYDNIYVIDNYSTDGTYELLQKYTPGINLYRERDYKKKGEYMTHLINTYAKNNIAFPIDIDEFIVYYDNNNISVDKNVLNPYLNNLPKARVYKANYIQSLITQDGGYQRATTDANEAYYEVLPGNMSKSFVNTNYYNGSFDHGNHIPCNDFHLTKICLIHFHHRNLEQMKKKILNNVLGFDYKNDLKSLKDLLNKNQHCNGHHHVTNQIEILENRYKLPVHNSNPNHININVFNQRIKDGCF